MSRAKHKGFTLIELMIVVAIIAILASVAYPSYQRYVTSTWRTAATACLSELSQGMARRYTVAMSYAGDEQNELPANGCVAQIGYTAQEIAAFKAGGQATLTVVPVAAPDQQVELPLSLAGFTAAFDSLEQPEVPAQAAPAVDSAQ